jgi:ferredoxin
VAYVITDACTACGACASVCPVEAISEGEDKYVIDPDACTDCGLCADECPFDAIEPGK